MKLQNLKNSTYGVIDVSVAITIGVVFAALMVVAYIIWTLQKQIIPAAPTGASSTSYNTTYANIYNSVTNLTDGFDNTIKILIVAIVIAVLAIALSYLMLMRQG